MAELQPDYDELDHDDASKTKPSEDLNTSGSSLRILGPQVKSEIVTTPAKQMADETVEAVETSVSKNSQPGADVNTEWVSPHLHQLTKLTPHSKVAEFYKDTVDYHREVLDEAKGVIAFLVHGDIEHHAPPPACFQVIAMATLTFFGEPRMLYMFSLKDDEISVGEFGEADQLVCVQLARLKEMARVHFREFHDEQLAVWPVMDRELANAILAVQVHALMGTFEEKREPWWKRILSALRIWSPPSTRAFIGVLHEQVGPSTAYLFARADFFTQKLWLLALWSVIAVIIDIDPSKVGHDQRHRIPWEIFKGGVVIWGIFVAVTGARRSNIGLPPDTSGIEQVLRQRSLRRNPTIKPDQKPAYPKLLLAAIPLTIGFIIFVCCLLFMFTNLVVYLIYDWGDCLTYLEKGTPCRSPQVEYPFWGWCAEVASDILLAILFEIFFGVANAIAEWIADLRAFQTLLDHQFSVEMLSVALSTIERIGTFGVLAFIFTPEWKKPTAAFAAGAGVDLGVDCSDLLMGDNDIFCFSRKLSVESRRAVFQKAFKGPFVVAPFIGILVKVVIPYAAMRLDNASNAIRCCCCRAGECFLDGIFHLLALIFTRDGGNVGCLKYLCRGWPFENVQLVKPEKAFYKAAPPSKHKPVAKAVEADIPGVMPTENNAAAVAISADPKELDKPKKNEDAANQADSKCEDIEGAKLLLVENAIRQFTRKTFSPIGELLEIKMSFMWILFFGPIMPMGVIPTLIARVLEGRSDLAKMLYVRRPTFPEPEELLHFTQTTFNVAVVCGSIGWSAGLSLITYNDNLYDDAGRNVYVIVMLIWIAVSFSLMSFKLGSLK